MIEQSLEMKARIKDTHVSFAGQSDVNGGGLSFVEDRDSFNESGFGGMLGELGQHFGKGTNDLSRGSFEKGGSLVDSGVGHTNFLGSMA
jgi:hypothetical protein